MTTTPRDPAALVPAPQLPEIVPGPWSVRALAALKTVIDARDRLVTETYEAQTNLAILKKLEIRSQDDLNDTTAVTVDLKKAIKRLEAEKKAALAPLKEMVENITNLYKPLLGLLEQGEKVAKGKLSAGLAHLKAEQDRALKAVATLTAGGHTFPARRVLLNMPDATLPKNMSDRKIWKFVIERPDLVPDPWLKVIVDEEKVQASVDSGVREIPGVRIFETSSVTIRTR